MDQPISSDKKTAILEVAERLFAETGFDGTSIRHIAKEAGINIAMVSYYFGSKEKMLESLIMSRVGKLKVQLESLRKEDLSHSEKISRVVSLFIQRIRPNLRIYQIVQQVIASGRAINLDDFFEVKKDNLRALELIILEGQQANVFRKDINIALIPTTIVGTYFQFHTNKKFYAKLLGYTSEEQLQQFADTQLAQHIQQTIKALLLHDA